MSIINLEKTFENEQLVYCNLDNKIIECICFTKLCKHSLTDYYNDNLGSFFCYKVKVITIYDIYKNIIYKPIQTNLFKDPIKINTILENLIENIEFFKTFIRAFIINNKLNGIKYYISYRGNIYKVLYDNILLEYFYSIKTFNIYNNEKKCIHKIKYNKDFIIYYKNYNNVITYNIYNNYIKIKKGKFPFCQIIWFYKKKLKIFRIKIYHDTIKIHEEINNNNEIIYSMECNNINNIKKEFFSDDINIPFSKSLRKNCIELFDYYKKNINNCIELIKYCLKKEKEIHNILLLNYKLEIINYK